MKLRKLNMWKCLTCQTIMPSLAINNCAVCNTDKIHGESLILWAKDWPCLNCGKNNFWQNIKCFYCSAFVNKKRAPQHNQISGKKQKLNDSESDEDSWSVAGQMLEEHLNAYPNQIFCLPWPQGSKPDNYTQTRCRDSTIRIPASFTLEYNY